MPTTPPFAVAGSVGYEDDGALALMGPADMDGVPHPGPGCGDGFGRKAPSLAGYDGFCTRIRRRLMVLGQVMLAAAGRRELRATLVAMYSSLGWWWHSVLVGELRREATEGGGRWRVLCMFSKRTPTPFRRSRFAKNSSASVTSSASFM